MIHKILCMMFVCFILTITGCTMLESSNINEQDNMFNDKNNSYNETVLNEASYQIIENERMQFRNDLEKILELLEREENIPIYKNCDNKYHTVHAEAIRNYFDEYAKLLSLNKKTSKEIKPIITLLMVEGISPPDIVKEQDKGYYYQLTFYQSIVNINEFSEKKAIRSPSDGIINYYIIGLVNEEGNWRVEYFGKNS